MTRALSLFSGGLDSILATRVIAEQGIEVIAVNFVTPFFGFEILRDIPGYQQQVKKKYNIDVVVEDISEGYLELLHNPAHGFGKNFNPCIDCKILMVERAIKMMEEYDASFLITGEVIGQRPMSQRRDTLNVIERDSHSRSMLLRPLSAKLLNPTTVEDKGLVDRKKLYNFSGRGRSRQIALAKEFGIDDYPSPAGGCILADPILSKRIKKVYAGGFVIEADHLVPEDVSLMLIGRQFVLPGGGWLVLGRDEKDNNRLEELASERDATLFMEERSGPFAILRNASCFYQNVEQRDADLRLAASLVVRYGKKVKEGSAAGEVTLRIGQEVIVLTEEPQVDKIFSPWIF